MTATAHVRRSMARRDRPPRAAMAGPGGRPRTGPRRSAPAPGPCGPGRCWSWPPRPRPRCGPGGSASRRRPGSAWSPRCRASGPRCTWTPRSPSRSASRRTPPTRCAPGWPASPDQPADPPVRQVVRDLLLRARHGRAGRLPPAGPGRGGTGAVARHHRSCPACRSWSWPWGPRWPTCSAPTPAARTTPRPKDQARGPSRVRAARTGPCQAKDLPRAAGPVLSWDPPRSLCAAGRPRMRERRSQGLRAKRSLARPGQPRLSSPRPGSRFPGGRCARPGSGPQRGPQPAGLHPPE